MKKKTNLRVGLFLYERVKEEFASEATFSGLAQVFVDHVARVHAGAKGKADGGARLS